MKRTMQLRSCLLLLVLTVWLVPPASAQEGGSYSLPQAIDYALQKNVNIKNSKLDALSAEARIGEIRAAGLPQVSGSASYANNLILQKMVLPANTFDPSAPADADPLIVAFGIKQTGMVGATWNQLLFNGSYFIGLKAAATYRELAQKGVTRSKVAVAESVTKAYYSAQVANEQSKVLDLNIDRLDSLHRETKVLNESGFVEKIDVDRIEVQLNNLRSERQKVKNLIELSYALLKFQMGMAQDEPIKLTDKLDEEGSIESLKAGISSAKSDYNNRVEFSLLQTQHKLADLDLRNVRSGYLPSVSASLGYGYNNGRNGFGELMSTKWFNNSALSLNISIPIFDGLTKHFQIQQKKIEIEKLKGSQTLLEQSIDLEVKQARTNLTNSLETIATLQRNVDLAKEVVRVSKIKYKEGVGSNIEVINAESSLKEAQTNYFSALYDVMIAKVDLAKANGELYNEK